MYFGCKGTNKTCKYKDKNKIYYNTIAKATIIFAFCLADLQILGIEILNEGVSLAAALARDDVMSCLCIMLMYF